MAPPVSWWTIFVSAMRDSTALKDYALVLGGKNRMASAGRPPRVVLFVVGSRNGVPDERTSWISSGWALVTARLWAPDDGDSAWDLRARFFQALEEQSSGDPEEEEDAGEFWRLPDGENERWDTEPDTAQQGQQIEIDILVRTATPKADASQATGEVAAVWSNRTATLLADLLIGATTATVDATHGYPATGVLHIDDEQISYSGLTPTSFTGLVRGINGTAAAAHVFGSAVYITPT